MKNRNPRSVKQVLGRLNEIEGGIDRAFEPVQEELQTLFDRLATDIPLNETSMRAIRRVEILNWRLKRLLQCPSRGCAESSRLMRLRSKIPWTVRSDHLSADSSKTHGTWRVVPPLRLVPLTGTNTLESSRDHPVPIADRLKSPEEFLAELVKIEAHAYRLLSRPKAEIVEVYSEQVAGMLFGSLAGNRSVARRLLELLDRLLLSYECPLPDCGAIGRLRCDPQMSGGAWCFTLIHYTKRKTSPHGFWTSFPALRLIENPDWEDRKLPVRGHDT